MKFDELLEELRIPFVREGHHHCRAGWLQLDCPFCGRDSQRWHLGYSLSGNYLNCWRCGPKSVVSTLAELTGKSPRYCSRLLGGLEVEKRPERVSGKLKLPKGIQPLAVPHMRYLRRRGYDPLELERTWKIAGIGLAPYLQWRVFIPIYYKSEVVSWTTRSISDSGQRYISASADSESVPHKSLLYGEDYARHAIVVVEGPLDVWAIGPGAVATCGIGFTQAQLLRMSKYPVRVVCFDNEPIAQRRAQQLCDQLEGFSGETFNVLLSGKDASETDRREIKRLRNEFLD